MARFVLQPCHLREGKLAPNKGMHPVVFSWPELLAAVAPSGDYRAKMALRSLRPGAYVGTVRDRQNPKLLRNFVVLNQDMTSQFAWLLRGNHEFGERLVDAYRVDEVKWEAVVQEFDTLAPSL